MIIYESAWKSQFSGLMQQANHRFVGNVGYVAVCLLGSFAGGGSITIGDIQAFIQYVRQFNQPNNTISNKTMNMLQSTAAAAGTCF